MIFTVNLEGHKFWPKNWPKNETLIIFEYFFRVLELMSQEQGNNHTWLLSLPLKRETMSWPMKGDFSGIFDFDTVCRQ